MSTINELDSSIEGLYSAFLRDSFPAATAERSPYAGISDAEVAKLRSRPLRELMASDLDRYVRSALTTWGGVEQFKYFLPRILELIVRSPGSIDALVFEKLDAAEWRSWPRQEQDAITRYLDALWRWALAAGPDVIDAGEILRGIGLAGHDLQPWLDVWRGDRGLAATEQIAHLICLEQRDLAVGKLGSYWHPKDRRAVLAFLGEKDASARIEAAFVEAPHGAAGRRLSTAADILAAAIQ
jgi:hypothetical protein